MRYYDLYVQIVVLDIETKEMLGIEGKTNSLRPVKMNILLCHRRRLVLSGRHETCGAYACKMIMFEHHQHSEPKQLRSHLFL